MCQIAEHSQPVVDRYYDETPPGQRRAIIDRLTAGSGGERAPVNPDKHRSLVRVCGCPDVECQAVFAHCRRIISIETAGPRMRLVTRWSELCCRAHAAPSWCGN